MLLATPAVARQGPRSGRVSEKVSHGSGSVVNGSVGEMM